MEYSFGEIKGKLAVLLIDMQTGFMSPEKNWIIPHVVRLLRFCGENGILVIHIETEGYGDTLSEVLEVLSGANVQRITKVYNSAFRGTPLYEELFERKIKYLIPLGVNGCVCVKQTVCDAVDDGYAILFSNMLVACTCSDKECISSKQWFRENCYFYENKIPLVDFRLRIRKKGFFKKSVELFKAMFFE
jgi:nicotinamidase-related amidase